MARLLVFFSQPRTLRPDEVAPWLRAQTDCVAGLPRLDVLPLQAATPGGAKHWDWMLEAEIHDPDEAGNACRGLLLDLRLLGTRPVAVVAGDPPEG